MRSQEDVYAAVRSCWASLFSKRGVHYRAQHGLDPWSVRIAVIIQEMLNPDVSGVIFTANILNGNRKEMLVNSTWGLGEGLVSGDWSRIPLSWTLMLLCWILGLRRKDCALSLELEAAPKPRLFQRMGG